MTGDEKDRLEEIASQISRVADDLEEVTDRVDLIEEEQKLIKNIPTQVAEKIGELKGAVETLRELVTQRANQTDKKVESATSVKNAMQFAGVILVPLLVALIGAYVASHAH